MWMCGLNTLSVEPSNAIICHPSLNNGLSSVLTLCIVIVAPCCPGHYCTSNQDPISHRPCDLLVAYQSRHMSECCPRLTNSQNLQCSRYNL